ncbi:MAG: DUF1206 domain-containing protein [Actinomycetota bacterium]|nr:DUF1206 domain-containing protein [Actinomycetota bacterium]
MTFLARFGLLSRGFVYLVIGWLTLKIALGQGKQQANQQGALADVAQQSYGELLLWALGLGFAAYAIWRLSQAAFGTATDGSKAGPRVQALARGIVYASFAFMTFSFIAGTSQKTQTHQQAALTARVMRHDYGRWLVGIAGIIVIVVGAAQVIEGVTKKFQRQLQMADASETTRKVVIRLGQVGTVTRGLVFVVAGFLVVDAAVTFDPKKSTGLDGALRTLAHQPFGPWLLSASAVGLMAFGLYGLASARYTKT